jgi:hypothetical protein
MKRDEMNRWVASALDLVPKGRGSQNEFRMILVITLRNALGPSAAHPEWSVADIVHDAAKSAGGQPVYDPRLLSLAWPDSHS